MASGKSSVGKKLANNLNLPFVDLDDYIVEKYNTSIRLLMYDKGQDKFREIERDTLNELIDKYDDVVISTGGGTPCFFDNMKKMNAAGKTIYLEVDIPTLVDRLMHSKKDRPLIWGKTREDLTVYAKELFERRLDYYNNAKYKVSGKNFKLDSITELIKM